MGISNETLAVAMSYVKNSLVGVGALKGAPCQIQSITPIEGGNRITYVWVDTNNVEHTSTMDVMDGAKGDKGDQGIPGEQGPAGADGSPITENAITSAVAVGGIPIGTTYPAGSSISAIISDLLEPTLYPTLTNPSASLSATGAKLLEKGATLSTTFTATFNRGSITPAYGTSGYRSGVADGYSLNGGTSQSESTWSVTVSEAQTSYQASVSYEQGEQPKDSKGNDYQTALPAGSVNTNTISYEFVNAIWANTANIGTIAKLSLVSKSAKQRDMVFPAQTVANPEVFDIPASWTVTAVQVKNDLSGAFEDASAQFTVTDVTHDDAGGTSTNYKRYTFNMGFDTGSRTVRVKWS